MIIFLYFLFLFFICNRLFTNYINDIRWDRSPIINSNKSSRRSEMAKIRLTTENINTQPESDIYNALHLADDWSNYDELYRAANSIHIM